MCGHCVIDGWVVQHGFHGDHVGRDAGEVVVLVDTKYVAKESVVVCYGLTQCVRDVLNLDEESACVRVECFVVLLCCSSMYSHD
jgi:hypothetical protein